MCGDIISVWNAQSVVTGSNRLILTQGAVQMTVVNELEQLRLRSTSKLTKANYHSRGGLKALLGRIASGVIGKAKKASEGQLYAPNVMKRKIQTRKRNGIQSTGIVGVAQMLAIWIGKLYQTSLMHLIINARTAERLNELKLTTSNHCQKVARTILITYNHYANLVTLRKATDESYL
jgi:hypothetical protein